MRAVPLPLVISLALVAACSSSSTNTGGPGGGTGLSATINGTAWTPGGKPSASFSNGIFVVAGLNLTYSLSLGVGELTTAGTYSLGQGNLQDANGIVSNTGGGWGTAFAGGSGTITFTTLTASHAVGTFSFDATPGSGAATGTLHVTNGTFDVTF
jgi:hypothetical protein